MEKIKIGGMIQSTGRSLVRIFTLPSRPGLVGDIINTIGRQGINIELLAMGSGSPDRLNLSLVIEEKKAERVMDTLRERLEHLGPQDLCLMPDVAVISVFGPHLREKPLVPGQMFLALDQAGLVPLAIANSISSVSCVLPGPDLDRAVDCLLQVFDAPFQVKQRPDDY